MQPGQAVTIVQLTDTHFFGTPEGRLMGVDTAATFKDVSSLANSHSEKPDYYLLTGDLSQDETEDSYARFADSIKDFKAPAYFLPGNHDARDNMRKVFKQSQAPLKFETSFIAGNWQIILLDTQVPGQVGGSLSKEELDRLDAELTKHKDKHALVTMHHHPVPIGSAWIDRIAIDNADQLLAVVGKHKNVKALLWGHVHQQFEGSRDGMKLMGTPSTCVQFKPNSNKFALDPVPAGYRRIKLLADGTIESTVHRVAKLADGIDLASAGY